jgi:hypothetical protein
MIASRHPFPAGRKALIASRQPFPAGRGSLIAGREPFIANNETLTNVDIFSAQSAQREFSRTRAPCQRRRAFYRRRRTAARGCGA